MNTPTERLSAALEERYAIEREIGTGGMATVYLAEDLKHRRKVAIKVFKPELAAVLGAERFVQEIATTASLQHPHILPLFDSGNADGFLYYVMPYVSGESLRDRLDRDRQLSVVDALTVARNIAAALEAAHRCGIVHRDIKPENILLQDGVAMLADFGIAIALQSSGGERLTMTGMSLGLVAGLRGETESALKDLRRAHELRPGDSNIIVNVCRFSQAAGLRNIWPLADEMVRIDPLYPVAWFGPAFTYHLSGQFQEAVPPARRAVELAGSTSPLHIYAAWIMASAGLRDEAMDLLRASSVDLAGSLNGQWSSFLLHALAGDAEGARQYESEELLMAASLVESSARVMFGAYGLLGRTDDAIDWTRIAIRRGFVNYPFLSRHDPFLESVRPDSRFQALMTGLRPRWEALVEWERSVT